jgi:hypothetical protein
MKLELLLIQLLTTIGGTVIQIQIPNKATKDSKKKSYVAFCMVIQL